MPSSPKEHYEEAKERSIQNYLTDKRFSEKMRSDLSNFRRLYSEKRNLSVASQESYLRSLGMLGRFLVEHRIRDFGKAKEEDLRLYLDSIASKSASIKMWSKTAIKVFYRWLIAKNIDRKSPFPPLVSWIVIGAVKPPEFKPEDFLSPDEVKRIMSAAKNHRDRAFIHLLFDSGCRIGELLNVQIKDVHLEDAYPYIYVRNSKTKPRPVYLKESIHDLRSWLESHPSLNTPNFKEAFLFVPIKQEWKRKKNRARLPYWTENKAIESLRRLARDAGIEKRVRAHEFRHIRISPDRIAGVPDDMNRMARGLSKASRILDRYSHSAPQDYAKVRMRLAGEPVPADDAPFKAKTCFRCKTSNDWAANYCRACASPLKPEEYEKLKDGQEILEEVRSLSARLKELEGERKERIKSKIRAKEGGSAHAR